MVLTKKYNYYKSIAIHTSPWSLMAVGRGQFPLPTTHCSDVLLEKASVGWVLSSQAM